MNQFNYFPEKDVVRLCAHCQQQFGIYTPKLTDLGWKITHGICRYHKRQFFIKCGFSGERLENAIKKTDMDNPVAYLGDHKNKTFFDWLKNPTPPPESH